MKKGFKISKLIPFLLSLSVISAIVIAGTFAKYTSEYTGSDTALVARWSFTGFGDDGTATDVIPVDLFSHLYTKHVNQQQAAGSYIIAPGVEGDLTIKMDFLADVDADVVIAIDDSGNEITVPGEGGEDPTTYTLPIEYSVDGSNWMSAATLADGGTGVLNFRLERSDVTATEAAETTKTVKWRWAYEDTDDANYDDNDTRFGKESAALGVDRFQYVVNVTITATQVAPATE